MQAIHLDSIPLLASGRCHTLAHTYEQSRTSATTGRCDDIKEMICSGVVAVSVRWASHCSLLLMTLLVRPASNYLVPQASGAAECPGATSTAPMVHARRRGSSRGPNRFKTARSSNREGRARPAAAAAELVCGARAAHGVQQGAAKSETLRSSTRESRDQRRRRRCTQPPTSHGRCRQGCSRGPARGASQMYVLLTVIRN